MARCCTTCRIAMILPLPRRPRSNAESGIAPIAAASSRRLPGAIKKAPQMRGFSFPGLQEAVMSPPPGAPSVMHRRQHGRVQMRDRTRVLEGTDAFDALFAADARGLHAAEGCTQI